MNKNTVLLLAGLGGAYFYLSRRQPVFMQQADGSYLPAGVLDRLTMLVTGVQAPPAANKSVSVNIPGLFDVTYNPTGASSFTAS
jgi:hypothetical protein